MQVSRQISASGKNVAAAVQIAVSGSGECESKEEFVSLPIMEGCLRLLLIKKWYSSHVLPLCIKYSYISESSADRKSNREIKTFGVNPFRWSDYLRVFVVNILARFAKARKGRATIHIVCLLKKNRPVDDSSSEKNYMAIEKLSWTTEELQAGKLAKLKKFAASTYLTMFRVTVCDQSDG